MLGVFTGTYRAGYECGQHYEGRITVKIRCNRWDCPNCGPRKTKKLYKRAFNGEIAAMAVEAGFTTGYNMKFLTLTYGGKAKRANSTPAMAAQEMSDAWSKLRKELRYIYGGFHFIKVFENHENGWPHLHVLLAGKAIAPREVLDDVTRLWRYRYGLGFVKLNWAQSPQRALKYMLKYLFKCPVQYPKVRMFSNSEGALEPPAQKPAKQWIEMKMNWVESAETYRDAQELLDKLGDSECFLEVEVFPVEGVPF